MSMTAVDKEGNDADLSILEQTNTAFDPTTQHLDLTKDEKRRTTALMMAIQAYSNLIIKDADMYIAMKRDEGRPDALILKPATIEAMVDAAIHFDLFIGGAYSMGYRPEAPKPAAADAANRIPEPASP